MNLKTALDLYEQHGPRDPSHASPECQATKVVHMHMTPEELAQVTKSWHLAKEFGKGRFLKQLGEVRQRLINMGFL